MKIKKKRIPLPLYTGVLMLFYCKNDRKAQKILKKYNVKHDKGFDALSYEYSEDGCYTDYHIIFTREGIVARKGVAGIIAHESAHIANWIFINHELKYDPYNDESFTYLLEWIAHESEKFIMSKLPKRPIRINVSKMKSKVYTSDDYAVMETDEYNFYYGYEVTDDETDEWCFTVSDMKGKVTHQIKESILRDLSGYKGDEMATLLLIGIGLWINYQSPKYQDKVKRKVHEL